MKHTKEAIRERGEIFTPPHLVNEMLNKLIESGGPLLDKNKTVLEPTCGNGNFLVEILNRRMIAGISHLDSIKTLYGIEIYQPNIVITKERLSLGSKDKAIWDILNNNIICADALNPNHTGWKEVGYMWSGNTKIDLTDFI